VANPYVIEAIREMHDRSSEAANPSVMLDIEHGASEVLATHNARSRIAGERIVASQTAEGSGATGSDVAVVVERALKYLKRGKAAKAAKAAELRGRHPQG
jgi:hypothetical protein